ncbi:MAG: hypothetical protein CMK09_05325 [Ponticaulis sp.]|nr:hypothetical protein [Ponticaulis sp.]
MSKPSNVLDQKTYKFEIEALNLYLRRTSFDHATLRIVGNFVMVVLIAISFQGKHTLALLSWTATIFALELFVYFGVRNYFRQELPPLEDDGTILGRPVTVSSLRFYLYMRVLVPTLVLNAAYCLPCLLLLQLPQPGPIVAMMMAFVTLLNVAGQYTYRKSMPVIAAILPAGVLILSLWQMTPPDFRSLSMFFGAFFIIHTISIAWTGVGAQRSLVTSRTEAEDEALARQDADEANRAKSQFLANMSHELRTPLNAIIGYSEMMQEDAEADGRKHDVEDHTRIILAGRRLLTNINDILDFSKIEAGRMEAEVDEVDLSSLIQHAADAVKPAISESEVDLKISLPDDLPAVWTDGHKLEQCLLNLLSNAAKFTHAGEIEISGHSAEISGDPGFVIEVRDTGIGLTDEQLSRLFTPFSQADNTFTRKYGGTGLGLVITERLIELLGGRISVESEREAGSTFRLHFPLDLRPDTIGGSSLSDAVPSGERPQILVIDDDADVHELLTRDLTSIGFEVSHAVNAKTGREKIAQHPPALILLDIQLPGETGLELLETLKGDVATRDIPVIIHSVECERQTSLQAGAVAHLTKPSPRDEIVSTVVRHAQLSQSNADYDKEDQLLIANTVK